jgi:hypothetical protein
LIDETSTADLKYTLILRGARHDYVVDCSKSTTANLTHESAVVVVAVVQNRSARLADDLSRSTGIDA